MILFRALKIFVLITLCTWNEADAQDVKGLKELAQHAIDAHFFQSSGGTKTTLETELDKHISQYNWQEIDRILSETDGTKFREVYSKTGAFLAKEVDNVEMDSRLWLERCVDGPDKEMSHKCAISLSSISVLENNHIAALDWAYRANKITEEFPNTHPRYWYMQYQNNAFLLIAFIYDGNIEEASDSGKRYVDAALKAEVHLESFFLINNISYLARNEIGPEAALDILRVAEANVDEISKENQEVLYYALAKNYSANDQNLIALRYYEKFDSVKSRGDLERAALANLALIFSELERWDESKDALKRAKPLFEGDLNSAHGMNMLLAEKNIAISENRLMDALDIDANIDKIDDLLEERAISSNRNRLSKNLQIVGERQKRETDRLSYEAQLSEQEAAASRRQFLLTLIALFFVLVLASWVYRSYLREQKLNKVIKVKNDELEESNQQLEGANDRLQRTFDDLKVAHKQALAGQEAKEKFIGVIGHELRTPLNPIINLAGVLEDKTENLRDRALLKAIKNAGKRLHIIVENMLAISANDESTKVYVEPMDVVENTTTILREFKSEIQSKVTELRRTGENLKVNILKDSNLDEKYFNNKVIYRTIVRNLFDNALKFTRDGEIAIELRRRKNGNGFVFIIRDTGAGMEPKKIDELVEPFQQAEMDLGRAYEGAGLGLAVVQKYCEQLGAKLEIDSKVNIGTTITIDFPEPPYQPETGRLMKVA